MASSHQWVTNENFLWKNSIIGKKRKRAWMKGHQCIRRNSSGVMPVAFLNMEIK